MKVWELLVLIGLFTLAAYVWGYNFGHMTPSTEPEGTVLSSEYQEISCNDIIMEKNGQLVCEINMKQEDDNIRVFKGKGALDDAR